jgi:hypothetical protein
LKHSEYPPVLHFSGVPKRYGSFSALKGSAVAGVHVNRLRRRMGMWWESRSPAQIFDNPLQERISDIPGHPGCSG